MNLRFCESAEIQKTNLPIFFLNKYVPEKPQCLHHWIGLQTCHCHYQLFYKPIEKPDSVNISTGMVKRLKIGHYLAKLWTRVWCLVFLLDHGVMLALFVKIPTM